MLLQMILSGYVHAVLRVMNSCMYICMLCVVVFILVLFEFLPFNTVTYGTKQAVH